MTILVSNEPDLLIISPTFDISGQWQFWSLTRYVICYMNFCYKERISEKDNSGWWWTRYDKSGHSYGAIKYISGYIQPEMTYLVIYNQKWHIWWFTYNQNWHIWSFTTINDISGDSLTTRKYISVPSLATRNDISGRSIATRNHIFGHSVVGGGGLMVPCVFL